MNLELLKCIATFSKIDIGPTKEQELLAVMEMSYINHLKGLMALDKSLVNAKAHDIAHALDNDPHLRRKFLKSAGVSHKISPLKLLRALAHAPFRDVAGAVEEIKRAGIYKSEECARAMALIKAMKLYHGTEGV
jgi:hypothetical protein